MKLENARVVVTGGAAGIGKSLAKFLADRGCKVVVADYDLDRATAAASEIGPLAHPVRCDVSDHASVEALAEQAYALLGGVDAEEVLHQNVQHADPIGELAAVGEGTFGPAAQGRDDRAQIGAETSA